MTMTTAAPFSLVSSTPEQFGLGVAPHLRAMSILAARLSSDSERDDVVQDALIRAWNKRSQFDPQRGTPAAWLLAITADQARRTRTRRRPLLGVIPGRGRPIHHELALASAIATLSGRQRLAIDCFYFAGLGIA